MLVKITSMMHKTEVLDITNLIKEDIHMAKVQYSGTGRRKDSVAVYV